jgi:hypothetical protein
MPGHGVMKALFKILSPAPVISAPVAPALSAQSITLLPVVVTSVALILSVFQKLPPVIFRTRNIIAAEEYSCSNRRSIHVTSVDEDGYILQEIIDADDTYVCLYACPHKFRHRVGLHLVQPTVNIPT